MTRLSVFAKHRCYTVIALMLRTLGELETIMLSKILLPKEKRQKTIKGKAQKSCEQSLLAVFQNSYS